MMRQEHPDDRFMLTGEERSQFREICKDLDGDTATLDGTGGVTAARLGWSVLMIVCAVLVFVGLAANSVLLVVLAAAGGLAVRRVRRR